MPAKTRAIRVLRTELLVLLVIISAASADSGGLQQLRSLQQRPQQALNSSSSLPGAAAAATPASPPQTIIILTCPGNPGCPGEPPLPPTGSSSPPAPPTAATNSSSGGVLVCPGSPGCPAANTTVNLSPIQVSPGLPGDVAPSPSDAAGYVTDGPAEPDNPRSDEVLPEELIRELATSAGELPADTITIRMTLQGVTATDFNYSLKPVILRVTSAATGTDQTRWVVSFRPQSSGRHLLQQQQLVQVTMYIYTYNPQLVWYRLAQPPLLLPTANSTSCKNEYCARLTLAGIPVVSSSLQISPSFNSLLQGKMGSGTTLDAIAAQLEANRVLLDNTRKWIGYVVGPVLAVLLLLLLWWQRQKILQCCRGDRKQGTSESDKDWQSGPGRSDGGRDGIIGRDRDIQQQMFAANRKYAADSTKRKGSESHRSVSSVRSSASAASSSSRTVASSSAAAPPRNAWSRTMDDINSVPSDDEGNNPMRAYSYIGAESAASRTNSESGTVITIRDYISDQAAAQQRWQQQQWSKQLNPLERDVIERYFGRMQQQVELMQKPSGSRTAGGSRANSEVSQPTDSEAGK